MKISELSNKRLVNKQAINDAATDPSDILVALSPFERQKDGLLGICDDCDKVVCIVSSCSGLCDHEISPLADHYGHILDLYTTCLVNNHYDSINFSSGAYVHTHDTLLHVDTCPTFHAGMVSGKFRDLFSAVPFDSTNKDYFVPSDCGNSIELEDIKSGKDILWCKLCARLLTPCKIGKIWPLKSDIENALENFDQDKPRDGIELKTLSKLHFEHEHGEVVCTCNRFNCTCQTEDLDQVAIRKMWRNMRREVESAPYHIKCMANQVIKNRKGKIPTAKRGEKYLTIFNKLWNKSPPPQHDEDMAIIKTRAANLVDGFMSK